MAVSNFNPRFLLLLIKAAEEPVQMGPMNKAKAYQLRRLLYGLRAEMRKEHHPLVETVEAVELSIENLGDAQYKLHARPSGTNFDDLLDGAGIQLPEGKSITQVKDELGMNKSSLTGSQILSREWEGSTEDEQDSFIQNLFDRPEGED